jgi:hypothetical protein
MHCDKLTEGIWSLLKRSMVNFGAADQAGPGPDHQAQAQEDPDPRLPGHHRPENRTSMTMHYEFNLGREDRMEIVWR